MLAGRIWDQFYLQWSEIGRNFFARLNFIWDYLRVNLCVRIRRGTTRPSQSSHSNRVWIITTIGIQSKVFLSHHIYPYRLCNHTTLPPAELVTLTLNLYSPGAASHLPLYSLSNMFDAYHYHPYIENIRGQNEGKFRFRHNTRLPNYHIYSATMQLFLA